MAYTTIDDPSAYFQTKIYTGNGGALAVTNDGNSDLQPDFAWFKKRGAAEGHALVDTNRGIDRFLAINSTAVEQHQPTTGNTDADDIASFDTDGFTFSGGGGAYNQSSNTYVAWQWKVNGGTTTSFSESGSQIGGARQVNTTAGISLITYTGNGSSGSTIPHGLSQTPEYVMVKNRGDVDEWVANGSVLGNYARLHPNHTSELATGEGSHDYIKYPNTGSTNLVTGVAHNRSNADGDTYMAWCFHSVQGYSKIGKYTGNGSQDGTFVYTGFKPAWIMAKRTDVAKNWYIADSARSPNNVNKAHLVANTSDAEDTSGDVTDSYFDILSNGFKLRQDFSHLNASGAEHIYMAFAEHPFVSSEGVPTTAR